MNPGPPPVRMQMSFTVGPGRNWLNLWKPAIDALGKILGHAARQQRVRFAELVPDLLLELRRLT